MVVALPAGGSSPRSDSRRSRLDNSEPAAASTHPLVGSSGGSEDPHSGSEARVQQPAFAGCFPHSRVAQMLTLRHSPQR